MLRNQAFLVGFSQVPGWCTVSRTKSELATNDHATAEIKMRWIGYVLVATLSSVATSWMYSGGHFVGPARRLDPPSADFAYSDFVSIGLTVVTVVLGALALVIGIVAFKTVREIKQDAAAVANKHSSDTIREHMKTVPDQVNTSVDVLIKRRLPAVIQEEVTREIEIYAKDGRLGKIIEKANLRRSFYNPEAEEELQPGFDEQQEDGGIDGKS